jgi:hypothetical protein
MSYKIEHDAITMLRRTTEHACSHKCQVFLFWRRKSDKITVGSY